MSITVINSWFFLTEGGIAEAIPQIREYNAQLVENEPDFEKCIWIQSSLNPKHIFQIVTYKSIAGMNRQIYSSDTAKFIKGIFPLIDDRTISISYGTEISMTA